MNNKEIISEIIMNDYTLNQIREALDIADLIGEKVKLRRTSRGYMGLCPFHQEDTPSFHVYTDTQSYYCFGCHESGDIFTYIMKSEALSFPDAVKFLAERAGIKLSPYHSHASDISEVLDSAEEFFINTLSGSSGDAAKAYMSRRNISPENLAKYSLGYSPNSWDALTLYLKGKGFSDKAILDSGLAVSGKYGLYDRFRGRIIFPIHDITGKIIAFGGRLLDGEGAKYINSPEGPLYSKRKNLYMLDIARKAIREKSRSILVEGYMDALRLHISGFTETVASLGTSLTPEQASILARYADKCYICYDSDSAGQAATIKGMYTLAENGLRVYVVDLPSGKDPDEFLSNNPPEKFKDLLTSAKPLIIMHLEALKPALWNDKTRREALTSLFDGLSRLNIDDVLLHMGSICEATLLPPEVVQNYLLKNTHTSAKLLTARPVPKPKTMPIHPKNKDYGLETAMCYLLMKYPECRVSLSLDEAMNIMTDEITRQIATVILTENVDGLEELWLRAGDTNKIGLLKMGENFCAQMLSCENDAERFVRVYSALKRGSIDRRIATIRSMPPEQQSIDELFALYAQRIKFTR